MPRAYLTLVVAALTGCLVLASTSVATAQRLPTLTAKDARYYSKVAIRRNFKERFSAATFKADQCRRRSRVRVRCRVGWYQGDMSYSGHTVIWLTRAGGAGTGTEWNYAYGIGRLDTYCFQVLNKPEAECTKTYRVK